MGVRGGGEVSCRLRLRSKENRKHSAVQEVRARKVLREGRVGCSHTCLDNVFAYMRPPVVPRTCFQKLSPFWLMLTLVKSKENI
jgi:hypothetical protein